MHCSAMMQVYCTLKLKTGTALPHEQLVQEMQQAHAWLGLKACLNLNAAVHQSLVGLVCLSVCAIHFHNRCPYMDNADTQTDRPSPAGSDALLH